MAHQASFCGPSRKRSLLELLGNPINGMALSSSDSAQVLADLGHLVSAGVEVAPALAIVSSTNSRTRPHGILVQLLEKVRLGRGLSEAMADLGTVFPAHVTAVVRAGEVSGSLGPALVRAADGQRRASKLRSQVRTALIYPSCVGAAFSAPYSGL